MLLIPGCGGTVVLYEQQLLNEADSLFKAGNFEFAKVKFLKIRDLKPESPSARAAQYYLGFINVYYENYLANWEAALREFKMFATLYPDDFRIHEVNSWIKLLVVMQSFKKDYIGANAQFKELKSRENERDTNSPQLKVTIETLTESLRNCYDDKANLVKKSEDLENVILDLEKKCQQAGK